MLPLYFYIFPVVTANNNRKHPPFDEERKATTGTLADSWLVQVFKKATHSRLSLKCDEQSRP